MQLHVLQGQLRPCRPLIVLVAHRVATCFMQYISMFSVGRIDLAGGAHIHTDFGDHFPDEGLDDKNYR
jgi:hypothetical protein